MRTGDRPSVRSEVSSLRCFVLIDSSVRARKRERCLGLGPDPEAVAHAPETGN